MNQFESSGRKVTCLMCTIAPARIAASALPTMPASSVSNATEPNCQTSTITAASCG